MTDEELVAKFQHGDMGALRQLRASCAAMVNGQVNRFVTGPGHTPRQVMLAYADEILVDSARSYRANQGAMFKTWLTTNLRHLDRFTKANANVAHVPESRANMITTFSNALSQLRDQKNRMPTDNEMADYMSIPVKHVELLHKSMRREIPESHAMSPYAANVEKSTVDRAIEDTYFELTPDEKAVFDVVSGRLGRPVLTSGIEIEKATGFSQPKISIIRGRIAAKMAPHLASTGTRVTDAT